MKPDWWLIFVLGLAVGAVLVTLAYESSDTPCSTPTQENPP